MKNSGTRPARTIHHVWCGRRRDSLWWRSRHEEAKEVLDFAHEQKLPVFILGGGSNIVVADNGFDGVVLARLPRNHGRKGRVSESW